MKKALWTSLFVLASASLSGLPATGQDDNWNSPFVEEILRNEGFKELGGTPKGLLESELYVQSERLSRSGITVLEKRKGLGDLPLTNFGGGTANQFESWGEEFYEVVKVVQPDGSVKSFFRTMTPEEVQERRLESGGLTREDLADQMTVMSDGLVLLGLALRKGIENSEMSGVLGSRDSEMKLLASAGSEDGCRNWLFNELVDVDSTGERTENVYGEMMMLGGIGTDGGFYPVAYLLGPACMLTLSAQQLRNLPNPESPEAFAQAQANAQAAALKYASLKGDEMVDGHMTKRIAIEGLSLKEPLEDGGEMTINRMDFWLDPEYFVRRKVRMEGVIKRGRKTTDFFLERENQDYRRVGDSYLYEPYREVMTVGGMLSDKDKKELAKAQKEMEQAKRELANMPPAQRAMVEGMFASQMQKLDDLANKGGTSITVTTTEIIINPTFDGSQFTSLSGPNEGIALVQLIQTRLKDLGFNPGQITGRMNQQTADAISAYQASRGMPVTGEPSAELAVALEAELAAQ